LQLYVLIYHNDGRLEDDEDRVQHVVYAIPLAENTSNKSFFDGT